MTSEASTSKDPLIGRVLDEKFRIDALVGRGAMGAVYRATQLALKKRIAIKVMNPDRPADGAYASRFKREAKAAARMDHPNSLRVIDVGDDAGLLYIAMEYIEGKDLFQTLKEEFPLANERIVNILSQVLAALAVAHEMGVVHRDLKPENIMILDAKDDEGRDVEIVKVCDFGIAKLLDTAESDAAADGTSTGGGATATGTLTAHGMLIGTPEYMSPEQARGEQADARSDIYSVGVILFQLLTGRLPFVANSKIRMVIKHVEEVPPTPSDIDSRVDLQLEAICMRALAKRPEERFQTAREMRSALRESSDITGSSRHRLASVPPKRDSARPSKPPSDRTSSGARVVPARDSGRATSVDAVAPPARFQTAETMDPEEASRAIKEARERLVQGKAVPQIPGPPRMPDLSTVPPTAARPKASLMPIVMAVVLTAVVVVSVMLAMR